LVVFRVGMMSLNKDNEFINYYREYLRLKLKAKDDFHEVLKKEMQIRATFS
jgi:hypothetical protein